MELLGKYEEKLWRNVFDYLKNNHSGLIFVSNIDEYEGKYLLKYLFKYTDYINVITKYDDNYRLISITWFINEQQSITWKDSEDDSEDSG